MRRLILTTVEDEDQGLLGQAQMMVIFPIIGGLAIGGFGVHRYLNDEMWLAIFDFAVAAAFFGVSFYTYLTGQDRMARIVSAFISVVGPLVLLNQFENAGYFWVYSSAIVLFYLLSYRWAIFSNVVLLIGVWIIHGGVGSIEWYSFLVTIGLINLFSLLFALNEERNNERLREMSMCDDLTGVGNRRAFVEKINDAINVFNRYQRQSCLIYMDIDRFKVINDTFGHATGDDVIKKLTMFVASSLRETDNVFRIGGDEFVIIAEGIDEEAAIQLSEKIRESVQQEQMLPEHDVTISLGVTMVRHNDTTDTWIARADAELYKAKEGGRNRVFSDHRKLANG